MAQENSTPQPSKEEVMLKQAISAIESGNQPAAREILTNLLKAYPNNPDYWVWLSAAMETQKESLYCLQAALKIDPTHLSARRGLSLVGGTTLAVDDVLPPFPMNHPNLWEAKYKQTLNTAPNIFANPAARMMIVMGISALVLIGIVIGVIVINTTKKTATQMAVMGTARPTVTAYPTKSGQNAVPATAIKPLSEFLIVTYTPTPIYAATPHGDAAGDSYNGAMHAYKKGQWENVAIMMAQVATAQPGSADALYFIGEANRLSGKYSDAISYYNSAIEANPLFAPSYLGRARTNMAVNNLSQVQADLDRAIKNDPNFAEAYLERGIYYLNKPDTKAAQTDLEHAASLQESPLVEINLARVLLARNENVAALEAAKLANEMDVTMLEGYLVLGMAYRANNQIDQAVGVLETYLKYEPTNAEAFAMLGAAYLGREDFVNAQENLDKALKLNPNNADTYFWMGQTALALKENDLALKNYQKARDMNPDSFDVSEGLAKAHMALDEYNNSYIVISKVEKMATKPAMRARFLFIRAQSLDQLKERSAALRDWTELMSLSKDVTTEEMQLLSAKRVAEIKAEIKNALTATITVTVTATPKIGVTSTPTQKKP